MINKQKLWFLTLFSLILVLSVYYITMPMDTSVVNTIDNEENIVVNISEEDSLESIKVINNEKRFKEMEVLRLVLTNINSTIDEKNSAYEKLKSIEKIDGEEEKLENKIKNLYKLSSFIQIDNNQIKVTISSKDHSYELANDIIRSIQEEYSNKMYITVKFQ